MTDVVTEPGLRERKRLATRRAILLGALQLVRDRGLDATTVDEISRVADISPRTFFNYFASKEQALVGEGPRMPDEAEIERFVDARGDLLTDLAQLFADATDGAVHDAELIQLRKEVFKQYPNLSAMRMETFRHFEGQLVGVVERRLTAEHPDLAADPDVAHSRAQLVTYVCLAAMRHAWASWAASGASVETIDERMRASFLELGDVLTLLSPRAVG